MGKVRRKRTQQHSKPVKAKQDRSVPNTLSQSENRGQTTSVEEMRGSSLIPSNMFSSMKIDSQLLCQKLPDLDARSTVTSKTFRGCNVKKKDKRKIRHEAWMQKVEAIKLSKQKAKEKKKREMTPIVGDMSVMEEALPTLELLLKEGSKSHTRPNLAKVRGIQKEKNRKKQVMSDMAIFKQVLKHPAFKDNPTATISEHLQNKMKQDDAMET